MSGDIDDVVGAAHDPKVAVFILVTSVGRLVITGIGIEIRLHVLSIFVPKRRKTAGRQRQPDHDVADLVIGQFRTFVIEYANVITWNRFATRAGFYRKQ